MATSGYGTLLKRNGTTIANCQNITGPGMTLGTTESTHQTSTAGWREYIATLLSGGEVTFDANFLPADATQSHAAGLLYDMVNRVLQTFSIVLTDSGTTTWSFSAHVTRFQPAAPIDGKLTVSVTLQLSGQPTLA